MPQVSIILPTYNGSRYIHRAIESALAQSFKDFELLVINDGSTDNCDSIVKKYLEKDKRIVYVKNRKNLGLQKSLNIGIAHARGKYIARIDDDDEWVLQDKLKKQVDFLEEHPDYVLVGTWFDVYDENDVFRTSVQHCTDDALIRSVLLTYNPFGHSTVLYRTDVVKKLGGYNEGVEVLYIEDYDLWLRMGLVGKFHVLNIIATKYLLRNNGLASRLTLKNRVRFYLRAFVKYPQYPHKKRAVFKLLKILLAYAKRFVTKKI